LEEKNPKGATVDGIWLNPSPTMGLLGVYEALKGGDVASATYG